MLRTLRFATLLLSALGLVMGGAHALELPAKLGYDAELYTRVTSSLYRLFGSIGAVIQVGALLCAVGLSLLVRRLPSFRSTALGALALALSLVLWALLVAPVNAEWGRALKEAPATAPDLYLRLQARWEYGHLAAFAAWLLGYVLLLASILSFDATEDGSSRATRPR